MRRAGGRCRIERRGAHDIRVHKVDEVRVDEEDADGDVEADGESGARRAPLLRQAEKRGGDEAINVDRDEQPAGHVKHKVEEEHVHLAEQDAVYVYLVVVDQVVAEQAKVQHACVAQSQQGQVGERGMDAHLLPQQDHEREKVANRAEYDPEQGHLVL